MTPYENLPNGWETRKLGDICDINPSSKEISPIAGDTEVTFLPMSAVSEEGELLSSQSKKIEEVAKGFTYFGEGDILIAKITPCMENGKRWLARFLTNGIGFGSTEFHVLRPRLGVLPKWIYYFVSRSSFRKAAKESMTGTAGQKRVPKLYLENLLLPLPPLEIQERIVSILDKATALKREREQANQMTDKILQAIFLQMFGDPETNPRGWDLVPFDTIATVERNNVSPEDITDGTKYVGLEHIEKDTGTILSWFVVKKGELKSNKFSFSQNHVLYGKLRPYLNKVSLPVFSGVCSTDILPIRPNEALLNRYFIAYLLKQLYFVKYATERSVGANLPRIKPDDINNLVVANPPIELQEKFASIARKVEGLKEKQRQSLEGVSCLFNSLLSKAFKGEL